MPGSARRGRRRGRIRSRDAARARRPGSAAAAPSGWYLRSDVEAAEVEAVVGVQVAEQHRVDGQRVDVALQRRRARRCRGRAAAARCGRRARPRAGSRRRASPGPGSDPEQPTTVSLMRPPTRGLRELVRPTRARGRGTAGRARANSLGVPGREEPVLGRGQAVGSRSRPCSDEQRGRRPWRSPRRWTPASRSSPIT